MKNISISRLKEGIERTYNEALGTLNPNHRHDDVDEIANDLLRARINERHRFNSFADQRKDCVVKWHICGHDYFYALSEMLDSAEDVIFIMDWWLSPELYLRRPPVDNEEWRLDRLLKKKAEQGVKVYVIVYKEVTQTLSMSSHHTKNALEELSPNIAVMRHPDHIGSDSSVAYWSHHEKVVVVDNKKACIGGLDACFGRWDTQTHPLADAHPTDLFNTLFPGQDYNNSRVLDFQQVDNYLSNQISVLETGRMPWQDVHMTMTGPAVLDVVQHFTERWNEIKSRKYKHNDRFDWLALPHDVIAAPNEAVTDHPYREKWHGMGRQFKQNWHGRGYPPDHGFPVRGSCHVQVVRSVGDWSHGVLTEHSVQNAYIQLIREANHFIYIENQFFISNTGPNGPVTNRIAEALLERILSAARSGSRFLVIVVIPEVPGFAGTIQEVGSIKTILGGQWRTMNRGGNSLYEKILEAGFQPMDYLRFYHLRTYDRINGPPSLIQQMEKRSGVKFHEAQVALSREWLGPSEINHGRWHQEKVSVKIPQETAALGGDPGKATVESFDFPPTVEKAREIIAKFEKGAPRDDKIVSDNVGHHAQMNQTGLLSERWLGSSEEERAAFITEQVYIHSKVMIIDDRRVIMGSANINDRSQKGDGDSEIALVVEDTDMITTEMNGRPYQAGRFAATLRRKLFRKHLGLIEPQLCERGKEKVTPFMRPAPIPNDDETYLREDKLVADPLSQDLLDLWQKTANQNTNVYNELFMIVPCDNVRNWKDYKAYVPKVKPGRVANPYLSLDQIRDKLSQVKGHLVLCPLHFLIEQTELVNNTDWDGYNPTLPVYI
ncbi:hypothetical protein BOTBODRAFT_35827 [Botryobasidium botryosum FD-172 SS1]|uniref:phospholipase D n=1 Tax=Botryobasidium botryosum (strain FD-172 SS1) TaxID=930990 RepID=A0A067M547_BOTB1|nr:hypothetical protein BOTBODRAFT_35827 [Botryobasidium botryosum FD-172 SS1]